MRPLGFEDRPRLDPPREVVPRRVQVLARQPRGVLGHQLVVDVGHQQPAVVRDVGAEVARAVLVPGDVVHDAVGPDPREHPRGGGRPDHLQGGWPRAVVVDDDESVEREDAVGVFVPRPELDAEHIGGVVVRDDHGDGGHPSPTASHPAAAAAAGRATSAPSPAPAPRGRCASR